MTHLSQAEENYMKTIFHIQNELNTEVSTNAIAEVLMTSAASVSDMLKKLKAKSLVNYEKYKGVTLTAQGNKLAIKTIRKHRLWEVFLVDKLGFSWDEVHEVAEELEHIQSPVLIERLDTFLGNPSHDPHGDPIPNSKGEFSITPKIALSDFSYNTKSQVVGVNDADSSLLKYLNKIGVSIGCTIEILEQIEFDDSLEIQINDKTTKIISKEISQNIYVS